MATVDDVLLWSMLVCVCVYALRAMYVIYSSLFVIVELEVWMSELEVWM